jgi:dipeptidase E
MILSCPCIIGQFCFCLLDSFCGLGLAGGRRLLFLDPLLCSCLDKWTEINTPDNNLPMKLYLSSYGLGEKSEDLLRMSPSGSKVGLIANALDNQTQEIRSKVIDREQAALAALGYQVTEIDLRHFFKKCDEIGGHLAPFDLLWVTGGNAFILNVAMSLSGFRDSIQELLSKNALTYGGYSAGTVVAGKSLRGIELVDKFDDFPMDYPSKTVIWDGLGLVDFSIAPHYKSNHPESPMIDKVVEHMIDRKIPHRVLRDGDVIIVDE